MNLAHTQPEIVETLSSIDRWLTVVAFVGSFALLLALGDVLVGWLLRSDRVYRALVWLGLGPWGAYEDDLEGPYPLLYLFDVDPATGKISPVPWTFEDRLRAEPPYPIPDVGADGIPRKL